MNTLNNPKKAAEDWHRADIVAALHKKGWSLRQLSRHAGLSEGALNNALNRPWPKAERIIAAAIGTSPETIWPARYAKRHFKLVFPSMAPVTASVVAAMGKS